MVGIIMTTIMNDATRMLKVMDGRIDSGTKSGAGIDQTYAQIYSVSGLSASVYLAGSREIANADGGDPAEPSEDFRIPSHLSVNAGDYVRVSMDRRGHRWIEEVIPDSVASLISINPNRGTLLMVETTEPATPPANTLVLFARDNAGKTSLAVKWPSGTVTQIGVDPV